MKYAMQMDLDIQIEVTWNENANERYDKIPAVGPFLAPTKEEWFDNEVVGDAYSMAAMYHFLGMEPIEMYFGVDAEGQVAMGNKDDYDFTANVNLGKIVAQVAEDWK